MLNSRPVFAKVAKYFLASVTQGIEPVSTCYVQLFLSLCLGPEAVTKGQTSKPKRAAYIPGETQELRRLKRKAIQNGSILLAKCALKFNPELKDQLSELVDFLDDQDTLFNFMVLLNHLTPDPSSSEKPECEDQITKESDAASSDHASLAPQMD